MGGSREYSTYSLGRRFKVPQGIFERLTQGYIQGQTKGQKPRGRRPQGFLAFGLVEDVPKGSPLENPEGGLEYSSEGVCWVLKGPPKGSIHHDTSKAFLHILFISRPGRSQGLLYKQPRDSLIN